MKLIKAVIRPSKLDEVRDALSEKGVLGLMTTEIKGYGRQSGHTEMYRGSEYTVDFVSKVEIETVVLDEKLETVLDALAETARTEAIGDGKVFVLDVQQAMRIRTGEVDDDAL
ncbi:MAG: P-II family nitrogen regulator [Pseudomonadota bacterium]